MDRLSTVTCVVIALAACEAKGTKQVSVPASRPDGAKVVVGQTAAIEAFCDLYATDDQAAPFHWPDLAAGSTAPGAAATWRWVNVWATWCEPCIEEMPRLVAWRDKLAAAGRHVELSFVSIDEDAAALDAFRAAHPGTPPSIRVASPEARGAWLGRFRLGDGAVPIHLFVSPANRLRCARAGGIRENDYGVVAQLVAE